MIGLEFRLRNEDRDKATDKMRMQRLADAIAQQSAALETERAGLMNRSRRAAADAAYSLQAVENDGAPLSAKVERLTATMIRCEERLRSLEQQALFLAEMRDRVADFTSKQFPGSGSIGVNSAQENLKHLQEE